MISDKGQRVRREGRGWGCLCGAGRLCTTQGISAARISGNLTDPTVRVQPAEGLTTGIESMLELPLGILQYEEKLPMK